MVEFVVDFPRARGEDHVGPDEVEDHVVGAVGGGLMGV